MFDMSKLQGKEIRKEYQNEVKKIQKMKMRL
jgi:hypothetical protein